MSNIIPHIRFPYNALLERSCASQGAPLVLKFRAKDFGGLTCAAYV